MTSFISKHRTNLRDAFSFVIDPNSSLYYYWLVLISMSVLYNYLFIIARTAFDLLQDFRPLTWLILDGISDLIYFLDIIIRLRTGYLDQGLLLRDCKKIALAYAKSSQFRVDIASLLPLQLPAWLLRKQNTIFLRFNRLFRLSRVIECSAKIETQSRFPFMFRIVYLVFLILIIMHWNGCLYYILSKHIGFDANQWVFSRQAVNADQLTTQYVSCFFWSIHMLTTIGEVRDPTTTFESMITIVVFLTAIVLIATLVGNIGSVISNMNMQQSKFQEKLDAIKSLMKIRKVSKELDQRVIKWFDYLHENNQTIDEREIFASLPEKLQVELAAYIHLQTLKNVNIFADCEEGLLKELVTFIKIQVYSPGDFVCKKGDIGKEMFIIKRGSLNVVSDDGSKVFVTLKAGSFFGELSILNIPGLKTGNRRTANVQSVGYSDLLCLTKEDLWKVLADYSASAKGIINKGLDKVLKDGLLNEKYAEKFKSLKEGGRAEEQLEEFEFDNYVPEKKLEKVEELYETLTKRVELLEEEVDRECEEIEKEMDVLNKFYSRNIGTTV